MASGQVVPIVVLLQVAFICLILCCAPAPQPPVCVQPPNTASLIFNPSDVTQSDAELGYNNTIPGQTSTSVGECRCTSGATQYYYTGYTNPDWNAYINGSLPVIMTLNCLSKGGSNITSMCVCYTDTECYTRNDLGMSVTLAPYCVGTVCDVYMFVNGPTNSSMGRFEGGPSITVDSQFSGGMPLPLPDSYTKIKSISCRGCPSQVGTTCIAA